MNKKQTRHDARIAAFKLIFQQDINKEDARFLIDEMTAEYPECMDNISYIENVFFGVIEKKDELEADIKANLSDKWRIDRISRVSLAVLKLAMYEIKYLDDVPEKVSINEAVEIEKEYDEPDNSAFVNGVLGSFVRKL